MAQPCSARSVSVLVAAAGKLEIVNASSLPQVTDNRNFPVFRSARGGRGNEASIVSRENSPVLLVALVGYRITSKLVIIALAIISIVLRPGYWRRENPQPDGVCFGREYLRHSGKERASRSIRPLTLEVGWKWPKRNWALPDRCTLVRGMS
jgi:hypothetical protein